MEINVLIAIAKSSDYPLTILIARKRWNHRNPSSGTREKTSGTELSISVYMTARMIS